jgi:hypothetical protein
MAIIVFVFFLARSSKAIQILFFLSLFLLDVVVVTPLMIFL